MRCRQPWVYNRRLIAVINERHNMQMILSPIALIWKRFYCIVRYACIIVMQSMFCSLAPTSAGCGGALMSWWFGGSLPAQTGSQEDARCCAVAMCSQNLELSSTRLQSLSFQIDEPLGLSGDTPTVRSHPGNRTRSSLCVIGMAAS